MFSPNTRATWERGKIVLKTPWIIIFIILKKRAWFTTDYGRREEPVDGRCLLPLNVIVYDLRAAFGPSSFSNRPAKFADDLTTILSLSYDGFIASLSLQKILARVAKAYLRFGPPRKKVEDSRLTITRAFEKQEKRPRYNLLRKKKKLKLFLNGMLFVIGFFRALFPVPRDTRKCIRLSVSVCAQSGILIRSFWPGNAIKSSGFLWDYNVVLNLWALCRCAVNRAKFHYCLCKWRCVAIVIRESRRKRLAFRLAADATKRLLSLVSNVTTIRCSPKTVQPTHTIIFSNSTFRVRHTFTVIIVT